MYRAEAGAGKYAVTIGAVRCGSDIAAVMTGGTLPHIGATALAVYEPERDSATVSTVTVYTHRDDAVASMAAKRISAAMKCTVSVSAGIHIDDAAPEELLTLRENAEACVGLIIDSLRAQEAPSPTFPCQRP